MNIEKTTIQNITAKITTTALLFFLALFTLTTNLKAQAVQNSKSGFFAGFVYLQGFQVDSSKSISGSTVTTSYEVASTSDTTYITADAASVYDTMSISRPIVLSPGIEALLKANCETEATTVTVGGIDYELATTIFSSFDEGIETGEFSPVTTTGDGTGTVNERFPTGTEAGETPYCYTYFYGDLSSNRNLIFAFPEYSVIADSSVQVAASSTTESDKLSGIGLQFGYRWEKWRASFTHYTGQGGDNELTNSLIMADYFFQEKFFVGAGLASIKLTNSSSGSSLSASATSPVLQVGYSENLTSNLKLSIGVLQYSSGLSLSSTTSTTTTPTITDFSDTQTVNGDSAVLGFELLYNNMSRDQASYNRSGFGGAFLEDIRTIVTQVGERTVNIQKTVTPVEGAETIAELLLLLV